MSASRPVLLLVLLAFCDTARAAEEAVTHFRDGKLTRKLAQPANKTMTIIGGMAEPYNSWFVVVCRDKPSID